MTIQQRKASIRKRLGAACLLTGGMLMLFGFVASPQAGADKPAGNNGTVKIDGTDFDTHPNNEPHVGCVFQVDFYGFDALTDVTMVFKAKPPTTDPDSPDQVLKTVTGQLDDDDNSGGGSEAGLDGQFTLDLSDTLANITPHPKQGYHVKLFVTADDHDGKGAQTKHKTFWIDGCDEETTTTVAGDEPGSTTTLGEETTTTLGEETTTTLGEIEGTTLEQSSTTQNAAAVTTETVLGEVITAPAELPKTGTNEMPFIFFGGMLLILGASLMLTKDVLVDL